MAHSDSGSASASVSDHWAALESMPSRVGRASLSSAGASRPPASRSPWSFLRDVRRVVQRESADPASPEEWRELLTTAYTEACGVDEERRALWDEVHELRESKRAVEELAAWHIPQKVKNFLKSLLISKKFIMNF